MAELKAKRFPNKVLKYLWDDAFKMNHDVVFNDSIRSFDYLIEEYSKLGFYNIRSIIGGNIYELDWSEDLKINERRKKKK